MATSRNRYKCAAHISGTNVITLDAAVVGYRAPANLWADGETMLTGTVGVHPYLLEGPAGEWELGYVTTTSESASTRTVTESSSGGFGAGTTGLTFSLVIDDMGAFACHRENAGHAAPTAATGGMAAGAGAECLGLNSIAIGGLATTPRHNSVAVGYGASTCDGLITGVELGGTAIGAESSARPGKSTAIGAYARASLCGEVALGASYIAGTLFPCVRHLPLAAWSGGAVVPMHQIEGGNPAVDFWTWGGEGYGVLGAIRLSGTVRVINDNDGATNGPAYIKLVAIDYSLWVTDVGVTILGTPNITDIFVGASHGTSSVSISATTGTPEFSHAAGGEAHMILTAHVIGTDRAGGVV